MIIKANQRGGVPGGTVFNFDDLSEQAKKYMAQVKADADKVIQDAQQEAAKIRKKAEQDGQAAAEKTMAARCEAQVTKQLSQCLPALKQATGQLLAAKSELIGQWEQQAASLALAIADRLTRGLLPRAPQITLAWVREALQYATGNTRIRIRLNPQDHAQLKDNVMLLVAEVTPLAQTELIADKQVSPGGCMLETESGLIDQRLETQLARFHEELTQAGGG